jgi:hypothetical protein
MCPNYCAVLDSSVLYNDYKLEKAPLRELLNIIRLCENSKMVIPKVVLDEHVSHFEADFQSCLYKLDSTIRKLNELPLVDVSGLSQPTINSSYSDYLRMIVRIKGIDILPYPKIGHGRILRRLFHKKKPFGDREKGYKDTLIWESILTLCNQFDKVVFVTSNSKDFAQPHSGCLHSDLVEDLEALSLDEDKIILKDSILGASEFLRTACGLTRAGVIENIVHEIMQYTDFDDLLTNNSDGIVECFENNPDNIIEGEGPSFPWLAWNIENSTINIESTEVVEGGEVVVHANAEFENEIEYSIFGYSYDDETFDSLGLSLYNMDSESDIAEVGGWMTFSLDFSFVYNPQNHETSGFEALDIRRIDLRDE